MVVKWVVGACITPNNTVEFMLESEKKWDVTAKLWGRIMVARETKERNERKDFRC